MSAIQPIIQPIIVAPPHKMPAANRLARYCYELDGTRVGLVTIPAAADAWFLSRSSHLHNEKNCLASFSLRWGALAMKGQPFIWMEHDSIPLKKGWAKTLTDEYERLGKPFMISSDSNPPHDFVGGIGVYSGDTSWMIPADLRYAAWDLWMVKNIPQLISHTPLIQHCYGTYDNGVATALRFPEHADRLRSSAVLFHRDIEQSLMNPQNRVPSVQIEKTFYHSGDLGDIIYHLETIRRLGGGRLMLGPHYGFTFPTSTREPMTKKRFGLISGLVSAQSYISQCVFTSDHPEPGWINLNLFRANFRGRYGEQCHSCDNLQRANLRTFGLTVQDETQAWLAVPKNTVRPIIFARSPRYQDDKFPWKQIVSKFGAKAAFVGLREEYESFVSAFKASKVKFCATSNLQEVAGLLAGSRVFVGNQSSPYAIAEGLKMPAVQESWPIEPNCLFHRQNLLNQTADFERIEDFIQTHL